MNPMRVTAKLFDVKNTGKGSVVLTLVAYCLNIVGQTAAEFLYGIPCLAIFVVMLTFGVHYVFLQ